MGFEQPAIQFSFPPDHREVPSELHWEWMESTLSDAYADKSEKGVIDFIMVVAHRPVKSFASRARNEAETMVNQRYALFP